MKRLQSNCQAWRTDQQPNLVLLETKLRYKCSTCSCLETSQTRDSAGFQGKSVAKPNLFANERISLISCNSVSKIKLKTSQTRDSVGFQVSLSQNQLDLQMSVFLENSPICVQVEHKVDGNSGTAPI
ncbi:hypothetical protein CSKR_109769 [Clonorchis sinensis]|uniref:Uncharacterized protein n=1 Tax=Clonorchis sinensis TaxID=79923 RepID=A0A3R7H9T2_CLOSI|nr:hypothetical protein CSKR_109769 [Clonorchis sinensis]